MKPKFRNLRSILAIAGSAALTISYAQAGNLYWDGATPAGAPTGGTGTWNTATGNWDNTPSADSSTTWVNANLDTAVFGSTAGTATLGTGITVGGLSFNTTAYVIDSSASTLSFGTGDNTILFNNIAAATINNAVGGTGNVILTAANPVTAGTLTLGLTSGGGWSGTTTVNAGMTLLLNGANQGLSSTSGITLNGGNITTTNTNTAQSTLNRISDTAAITSNGGTFTYTNTAGANLNYTETLGSVELGRGQTNFLLTTNQNNATNNSQTLILSGLTRTGASNTSVAAFLAGGTGPQASGSDNMIRVNGITTSTATGQIHGSWATTGVSATNQSDYAKFVTDGTNGFVAPAGITHSLESTWTTPANSYTFNGATPKAAAVLSGTRNMTGLKVSTVSSATGAADSTTERVTWSAHGLVEGAPFVLSGSVTGGLATAVVYFARNVTANDFQISLTPTGSIIDLTNTNTNTGLSPGILVSSGNNLGTTGILTTEGVTTAITATGTGVVTLPSTTSAALYVTTAGPGTSNLIISAPIADNGAGVLTLVKSGVGGGSSTQGALTLTGNNTFTGGMVVNSGTLLLTGTQSFTGGVTLNGGIFGNSTNGIAAAEINGNNITVNGLAAMDVDGSGDNITGTVTINSAAVFKLTNDAGTAQVSGVVSGTGILDVGQSGGSGSNITLTHTANTFTGGVLYSANNNGGFNLSVNSFLDSASPGAGNIVMGYGGATSTQTFTLHTGAIAPMNFTNRQFELRGSASGQTLKIANNSSQAFAINSNLNADNASGTKTLTLGGNGTGLSTFGGNITNGGLTSLALTKADSGSWTLSGTNTYTGATTVSAGLLNVTGTLTSAVTVSGTATLSGSGTTTGTLALGNGTTIVGTTAGSSFKAETVTATSAVKIAGSDGTGTIGSHTIGVVRYNSGTGPNTANFSTTGYHAGATVANVGGAGGETQLTYTNAARTWNSASSTWDAMTTNAWQQGDLKFGHGDAVSFDDTGTGNGGARAITLNSLVTPGSVTFNNTTSTYTLSGTGSIAGPTGLTKSGNGTVTISNTNLYTGATTVSGGKLIVNGNVSTSSLTTVAVGATLGGSGTVGATTVVGTLAIGNSAGTMNLASLSLDNGSTYLYEMTGGVSPGAGSADLGDISGTLSINTGALLDLVELGIYTTGNKFTLFAYDGSLTGNFSGLLDGATFTDDLSNPWTIDYNDTTAGLNGGVGTSYVTITAIPEPNFAALIGGFGILALLRRRR